MFVTTLDQNDITWLAFAAGIAAGSGNEQAHQALYGIIARVQPLESPLDRGDTEAAPEPVQLEIEGDDFGGTLDPQFMPPMPAPPSRPTDEFGSGRGMGGVTGTPIK